MRESEERIFGRGLQPARGLESAVGGGGLGGGHAPVFVVTGSSLDASTINVIMSESGALEFFKKPVKMPDFIAAVHRHLKTIPQ